MARQGRYLGQRRSKPVHAVLLGALLGFVGFLVGVMATSSVRVRYVAATAPAVPEPLSQFPFTLYAVLGCLTVGGTVALLYERYGTVAPSIVALLVFLSAVGVTTWRIRTWPGPSGPQELIPPLLPWVTVYEYVLLGWPLVLVGVILLAGVEHRLELRGGR